MEDDNNWHYRIPNENELSKALKELKITIGFMKILHKLINIQIQRASH